MKTKNTIDVHRAFLGLQEEMEGRLARNREILNHPVAKGTAAELEWVRMLQGYLPSRYRIEKAFVVDHTGDASDEIDVVVFDRHFSPFLLNVDGALHVPAESVYAVMERKQTISPANLRYAGEKAASVRRLKRTSAKIVHAGGVINDPKKPFEIPAGILTLGGKLGRRVEDTLSELGGEARIQFGCSLQEGSFGAKYTESKVILSGVGQEKGLITFFLNLVKKLQSMGSVPAMDIDAYIDAMDA